MTDTTRRARIVTFYSYKGGTGRSMALANVAWILASTGKRVLVIDWDLEAPGLHRYFHPFLEDKDLTFSDGVIDFVMRYSREAAKAPTGDDDWYIPLANLRRYASSLRYPFPKPGTIDLVPAGRQGPDYATRVNSFNWQNFYEQLDGGAFLEAVKQSLAEYDFVLVDSRTGVSDTSGICTVQMPDTLVICFTPNAQSIEGAAAVAESAMAQRMRANQSPGLMIYPVMTRVMQGETDRVNLARQVARKRFDPMLWQIPERHRDLYWGAMSVAHVNYYGFEEVLAVFGDEPKHTNTMLASMEAIAGYLLRTRDEAESQGESASLASPLPFPPLPEKERTDLLALFVRQPAATPAPPPPPRPEPAPTPEVIVRGDERYWFYLSYARRDQDRLMLELVDRLQESVRALAGTSAEGFFDRSGSLADSWTDPIARALATARTFVPMLSPRYLVSRFCGREFTVFRSRTAGEPADRAGILPIVWTPLSDQEMPSALASLPMWDYSFPAEYRRRGARQLLGLSRNRSSSDSFLQEFANLVVQAAKTTKVPVLESLPPMESVVSAFETGRGSEAPRAASTVNFLFLAPTRQEAERAGLSPEAYGDTPGLWRPFGRSVSEICASAATGMNLVYHEIAPSFDLPADEMSIVLIDGAAPTDATQGLVHRVEVMNSRNRRFVVVGQPSRLRPNYAGIVAASESELVAAIQKTVDEMRLRMIAEYPETGGGESIPKL